MRCAVFSQKEGQGVGGEGAWHPRVEMMGSECGEVRAGDGVTTDHVLLIRRVVQREVRIYGGGQSSKADLIQSVNGFR